MSKKTGGPAFPIKGPVMTSDEQGMTLRDYFAVRASEQDINVILCFAPEHLTRAQARYRYADAMLEARKQ